MRHWDALLWHCILRTLKPVPNLGKTWGNDWRITIASDFRRNAAFEMTATNDTVVENSVKIMDFFDNMKFRGRITHMSE